MKYIISLILLLFCIIEIKSDKASQVIQFAKSKIGCGYVWGATGQILTPSELQKLKRLHPDKVDESIVKKWMNKEVYDCAGFVYSAFKTVGITLNTGATLIWEGKKRFKNSGRINTLPTDKVCILFKQDTSVTSKVSMSHTGIYILNGEFIHSGGSKIGVQPGKMAGSFWTHWALLKDLYEEVMVEACSSYPCQGKVANASSGEVKLRKGPSTNDSIIIKIKVGEIVTLNSYKDGWYSLTYGNKNGYMMAQYIVKA